MRTSTLIIEGVDLELLEEQRLQLATIPFAGLTKAQVEALRGIQSMLDNWADERFFNNER